MVGMSGERRSLSSVRMCICIEKRLGVINEDTEDS